MREMVLNHASILVEDRSIVLRCLKDVASGMSLLRRERVVTNELKMIQESYEIPCTGDWTLYDALFELQRTGAREEYRYLSRLFFKAPLRDVISESNRDRLLQCQATIDDTVDLSPSDGEPLLYCAFTDGIAIGFPSYPVWDHDQVEVTFEELYLDGDEFGEVAETIDNLTRSQHAEAISERHRSNMRDVSSFGELWERRSEIFPYLMFGLDVEDHLTNVNTGYLDRIVRKLSIIDGKSGVWASGRGFGPPWRGLIRDESETVYNDSSLRERRRFRTHDGNHELFMYHASFSRGNRIHLRSDPDTQVVEIGYIGTHLPTKKHQ